MGFKADSLLVKDFSDLSLRLRNELSDITRTISSLQHRMGSFDSVLQKENTDFHINLIERKLQAIEQRLARITEEKSGNSGVISALYNFPATPSKRPATSKGKASIHLRNMSYQHN
jgi:hypothetical protein